MEMVRGDTIKMKAFVRSRLLSRENIYAGGLCVIVILVIIVTTDAAPQWIYQGF